MQKKFAAIMALGSILTISSAYAACPSSGCSTLDIRVTEGAVLNFVDYNPSLNPIFVVDLSRTTIVSPGHTSQMYGPLGGFGFVVTYELNGTNFQIGMDQTKCNLVSGGPEIGDYLITAVYAPATKFCTVNVGDKPEPPPVTSATVNIYNQTLK